MNALDLEHGDPTPRDQLVVRSRLIDRLEDRLRCRLTTIEAGAGFGKTSVLRQCIADTMSLDRATELVATCRDTEIQRSHGPGVIAHFAKQLACSAHPLAVADAVLAASPRPVVLWIDDVHHLTGTSDLVDRLLGALPANGHLVLVGRSLPHVTSSRFELEGQVLRLVEDDLRFDVDERSAFFHLRGVDVAEGVAADATGWPAVMELELAAGRSGAADYLTQEVLVEIEPEPLDALRRLAQLHRIDDDMVSAVTDFGGSLTELVAGLPLVTFVSDGASGDAGPVVELHDLLRDALADGQSPDQQAAASRAIADELLRRGDLAGAARRYADVADDDGIERVARRLLEDLHLAAGVGDRIEAIDTVSAALTDSATSLSLRGALLTFTDPINAERVLDDAIAAARHDGRDDLLAINLLRRAEIAHGNCDADAMSPVLREFGELAERGEQMAGRLLFLVEIWNDRLTNHDDRVANRVDRLLDPEAAGDIDDEVHAVAVFYRTITAAYRGDIRGALADVERYSSLLPPGLFADRLAGFVTIQLWMLGEQTDAVRETAERLVNQIESRGQVQLFVEGAATTSIFHASTGNMEAALELVERAERRVDVLPPAAWARHSVAQARAVVDVLRGREDLAAATLEAAIPPAGPLDRLPIHIYGLTAALSYILVPRSRPSWDAANVGGDLAIRLDVARALVAFRDDGDTTLAAGLPWAEPHRLRPWAFEPHLAELAVAAVAGGNRAAGNVLGDVQRDLVGVFEQLESSEDEAVQRAASDAIRVTPRRPAARIEIGLLGPLSVRRNGVEEADAASWRRARVRDLVSLLAHEGSVTRMRAAEVLWPSKDRKAGQNNLRSNLSYLLQALEPNREGSSPSWFLRTHGDELRLEGGGHLALDVVRFESHRAAATALDGTSPRRALTDHLAACELYRGDYLAGTGLGDAVYFDTLRMRGDFVASATRAADLLVSMGEPERAEQLAQHACSEEPLHEPLQRALVTALFTQRRFGAARDVLGHLLGELRMLQIPPEPETVRQAERLQLQVGATA